MESEYMICIVKYSTFEILRRLAFNEFRKTKINKIIR